MTMVRALIPIAFALMLGARVPQAQAPQVERLPDVPGKAIVEQVCATCHGVELLVPSSRTVTQWRDTIGAMKTAGAKASDEEWKTVLDYIMGNLAFLNINKATVDDVRLVFGVAEKVAQAVIGARDKQGGFKTVDDLKQIPDLDPTRIEAVRTRLSF